MPNHVTNIITYDGDRKQIAEMLEACAPFPKK